MINDGHMFGPPGLIRRERERERERGCGQCAGVT